MKRFILLSLLFCSLYAPLTAQDDWVEYSWEPYNLDFELPSEFSVTTNNADALEANGDGIRFAIYPYEDEQLTKEGLAGFVVKMAETDLNLSEIDEMELIDIEGMTGGFLSGQKDGLMYLVLGLISKETSDTFYAFVAFEPERADVIADAMAVFESFDQGD